MTLRQYLHGSGQIFAQILDPCKLCYSLQWCTCPHGSVQILDQSRHFNGFFTALLLSLMLCANHVAADAVSGKSNMAVDKNFAWSDEEI